MSNFLAQLGISPSLLNAMNSAAKANDIYLSRVDISIQKLATGIFSRKDSLTLFFRCHTSNPYRTGIGGDERCIIFKVGNILTYDYAVGVAAEEVAKCITKYPDTNFVLFGASYEAQSLLDAASLRWVLVPEGEVKCPRCGDKRVVEGYIRLMGVEAHVCKKCLYHALYAAEHRSIDT